MKEIPKSILGKDHEDRIYKMWEQSGAFAPDPNQKEPYSIMMPPPNATGTLHLGHATMLAIEDILIRFKRMQGFPFTCRNRPRGHCHTKCGRKIAIRRH